MLAKVSTCAVIGLDGAMVETEVDIGPGLPAFTVVGLPDTAIQEARERVRAAIRNSGCEFPLRRITVNLAPAVLRKEGPAYDLPIAVGVLRASEQIPEHRLAGSVFLGELSLDGHLRHTPGILPMVALARDQGAQRVFVPDVDATEASIVDGIDVFAIPNLAFLVDALRGDRSILPWVSGEVQSDDRPSSDLVDFADVRGQEQVKRALEIAAAGAHNILMVGPPGAGKTLLARAVPGILPPLHPAEALEVSKIYSVAGLLERDRPLITRRPFRAPHHTTSHAGLVGGGKAIRPGEITLSHRGVLFLDELPEFGSHLLETLRQPLEDGKISISRASGTMHFPAKTMLIAAMNPCPCGYLGDTIRACTCAEAAITRYARRVSGPILDRIDLYVHVPRVDYDKLASHEKAEASVVIRARVSRAREIQARRFSDTTLITNADMGPAELAIHCVLDPQAKKILQVAATQMGLSARGYHRVLKLSRTIADLAGSDAIAIAHVAEALQYRARGPAAGSDGSG